MAIYGSILRRNYDDDTSYTVEEVDLGFGDTISLVYEEYLNQCNLLESCMSSRDRLVVESKIQVLQELSFKDIKEKILNALRKIKEFIKRIIDKIRGFFSRKKKSDQKDQISDVEKKLKDVENKYDVSLKNMKLKDEEIEKLKKEIEQNKADALASSRKSSAREKELEGRISKLKSDNEMLQGKRTDFYNKSEDLKHDKEKMERDRSKFESEVGSKIDSIVNSLKEYLQQSIVYFDLKKYSEQRENLKDIPEDLFAYQDLGDMSFMTGGSMRSFDNRKPVRDNVRATVDSDSYEKYENEIRNFSTSITNATLTDDLIYKISKGSGMGGRTSVYNSTLVKDYIMQDLNLIRNSKKIENMTVNDAIELAKSIDANIDDDLAGLNRRIREHEEVVKIFETRLTTLFNKSKDEELRAHHGQIALITDLIQRLNTNISVLNLFVDLSVKKQEAGTMVSGIRSSLEKLL